MRSTNLLRIAVLALIAVGVLIVAPGRAPFDPGIAAAWAADDDGGAGRCPGGR